MLKVPVYSEGLSRTFLIFGQFGSYSRFRFIKTDNLTNSVIIRSVRCEFCHLTKKLKVTTINGLFTEIKHQNSTYFVKPGILQ